MKKTFVLFSIGSLLFLGASVDANHTASGSGLNAPSNLVAKAISTSQINLSWKDNSDNETGFKVERSLDGSNFTKIAEVGKNVTSYSNTGLATATTYYYRVRAFNVQSNKVSSYSNVASAMTFVGIPPAAPSNLVATAGLEVATTTIPFIDLAWQDNANNEKGFVLERSTDGANFVAIASVPWWAPKSYRDWNVTSGVTYYYRVKAFNNFGSSAYSNTASATAL